MDSCRAAIQRRFGARRRCYRSRTSRNQRL